MPTLETQRLIIRPFTPNDLDDIHRILDVEFGEAGIGGEEAYSLEDRREWLQWTVSNYEQLARLNQPPYGDRAIVLKGIGQLIGACGFVPCLTPFEQLPAFRSGSGVTTRLNTTEFGLYYALSPTHHRHGYATEAAKALIDYAFKQLRLKRIVATTTYDNAASIGVMRKLGMRIERNPYSDPPWLQVVGILDSPPRAYAAI